MLGIDSLKVAMTPFKNPKDQQLIVPPTHLLIINGLDFS